MANEARSPWLWLTPAFLLLPVLLLFWEIVFAGRVLYWGVPLMQFGPWQEAARTALTAGEWPLWNPLLGNGAPLLANYQLAFFYPPNWLNFLLASGRGMSLVTVLHVLWGGLGAWVYTRSLGLRPFARLMGALSFMLSGYFISRLGFPSIGGTVPWLPWILWAGERLLRDARLRPAAVLAVCLSMQWLAGHAQTSFYTAVLLAAYLLWRVLGERPIRWRRIVRVLGLAALAAMLAFALAAVQLLPTAEFLQQSQRAAGVGDGQALTYSLWPMRLISFFAPRFFGNPASDAYWGYCCNFWEDNGYVGLLPLLLALSAGVQLLRRRGRTPESPDQPNRSLVAFYSLTALVGLLLALGIYTPLFPFVFKVIPGFGQFQAPARLLLWWTWAVSMLAALAAETWRPNGKLKRVARYGLVVGLALLIAAGASTQILVGKTLSFAVGIAQLGFGLLICAGLALRQPGAGQNRTTWRWAAVVLLFVAIDLVVADWGANPTITADLYQYQSDSAAELRAAGLDGRTFYPETDEYAVTYTCREEADYCDDYLSFAQFGPDDEAYWQSFRETLLPNMAVLDNLPSANNFDPLLVGRHAQLLEAVNQSGPALQQRLLRMMGVQTLVTAAPPADLEMVLHNRDVYFAALPDPLPRSYVVFDAQTVRSPAEALNAITAPDFDPATTVVLETEEGVHFDENAPALTAQAVPVLTSTFNTVTIHLTLTSDGILVLSDTYYPGWQATVDGEPAQILSANLAFRGVFLPAGEHLVQFHYRPASFRVGAALSAVSWGALGVAAIAAWVAARRRKSA